MTQISMKTSNKNSKARLRSWLKILKTSNFIEKKIRENFREEYQTTLPRFDVMSALYRSKNGLKMNEISDLLKVSNGNITGIIDRLVDDGLVLRVSLKGDRRSNLINLTNKGKIQFQEYAWSHESWINMILNKLSGQDAQILINLLNKISDKGAINEHD